MKPSARPSAKKLLPPKQKQKEKKLLPSAEASAFGPPLHFVTYIPTKEQTDVKS